MVAQTKAFFDSRPAAATTSTTSRSSPSAPAFGSTAAPVLRQSTDITVSKLWLMLLCIWLLVIATTSAKSLATKWFTLSPKLLKQRTCYMNLGQNGRWRHEVVCLQRMCQLVMVNQD
ncbi:hypothetical protein VPH35_112778 [Triticum aestivum]